MENRYLQSEINIVQRGLVVQFKNPLARRLFSGAQIDLKFSPLGPNLLRNIGLLLLTSYICRIYVGCINYDTREESIKQAFNAFGPIRSITMSWDPTTQVKYKKNHHCLVHACIYSTFKDIHSALNFSAVHKFFLVPRLS